LPLMRIGFIQLGIFAPVESVFTLVGQNGEIVFVATKEKSTMFFWLFVYVPPAE